MGKWHLGQREMYLPTARGFDYYLGIPYSDDMGDARATPCTASEPEVAGGPKETITIADYTDMYRNMGYMHEDDTTGLNTRGDPGASILPLVYQDRANKTTTVLEQPLDFTHLAEKYEAYVTGFINAHATAPFFLYMPFSHVSAMFCIPSSLPRYARLPDAHAHAHALALALAHALTHTHTH
jgi:arylsulfatase A